MNQNEEICENVAADVSVLMTGFPITVEIPSTYMAVKATGPDEVEQEPDDCVVAKFLVGVGLDEKAHGEAEKCLDAMLDLPALPSTSLVSPPLPKPVSAIDRDPGTKKLNFIWHVEPNDSFVSPPYCKFQIGVYYADSVAAWTFCNEIQASPLPMALSIRCVGEGVTFLTVRGVDFDGRVGPCATPCCFMKKSSI